MSKAIAVDSSEPENKFSAEKNASMWAINGHAYFPTEHAIPNLPPGHYTVEQSPRGTYFNKVSVITDELLILPDSASEEVVRSIEDFWTREAKFRELGFLWKRGFLLCGPAGGGKSSTLRLIAGCIIRRGGLAVYLKHPATTTIGLELLRRIEPNRPIVVLMEDLDAIMDHYGEEHILALLDGELQIDNVVFIATTNYPEKLDKRIKNRPSRFDVVRKIDVPSAEARQIYLSTKNPRLAANKEELDRWVRASKGYSVAHLKELILAVEALGDSFEDTIARLNKMMTQKLSSEDETAAVGFTSDNA